MRIWETNSGTWDDEYHRARVLVERFCDDRQVTEVDMVRRLVEEDQEPGALKTSEANATNPFCPSERLPIFV